MTFYPSSRRRWNLKISGNCRLAARLFSKFLTCNLLHRVSLPAAFAPRRTLLSEFIIFWITLSIPFSFFFFFPDAASPLFLPSLHRSHYLALSWLMHASSFCVSITTQIQRQSSQLCVFVGSDTRSCHPGRSSCIAHHSDFSHLYRWFRSDFFFFFSFIGHFYSSFSYLLHSRHAVVPILKSILLDLAEQSIG